MTQFGRLMRDERGATAIEYAFLAALIGMAIVASATQIGQSLKGYFEAVNRGLN